MTEEELQQRLPEVVLPGEKVIWSESPPSYVFILHGFHSILYGLTWIVLGLFWFYGAGGVGKDSAFEGWWRLIPVFSLPFVFAGLSFFLYPLQLYQRAQRTWYLVTERRALIVEFFKTGPPILRVFAPEEIGELKLNSRWDRLQDLVLTRRAQELPHLPRGLDSGYFGLRKGTEALEALRQMLAQKA